MRYKSINEIEKFSFEDCMISRFEIRNDMLYLEVEALIVRADNSQNTNYTESYAGKTIIRMVDGKILFGVKDGYRYYNANDELIKETPDESLTEGQILELARACQGAYLFSMIKKEEKDNLYFYSMGIEFVDDENTMEDSYQLEVSFEKAIFEWDFYMNRVQR